MRLTFIGADHEVTGSCHFLEACGLNILIDCGMEQGINKYENAELPIPYSDVDYVLVTHAHIDHVGLLPLIYARGFRGQIMATRATCDLCDIMLKDCAHIQESEAGVEKPESHACRKTGGDTDLHDERCRRGTASLCPLQLQ